MMKVCVLFMLAALPALSQFGDARSLQHQPIKPGMTCASDAYVVTWVAAHGQFECLAVSGSPTGAAGGVLGGTYPSPTFAGGASFNANAATFLNGAGSFTSPGTANARITFSNVASATMTLTGVAVKAVVTCWDSSVSPARLFIPDSVEQTDADTLTFNFSPNATGYCDGSTGIGLTGATGPTGPAGGVTSVFGSTGVITTLANPTFTGTMTVGTSLSVDASTGIAASSKLVNVTLSGLTGIAAWAAGAPSAFGGWDGTTLTLGNITFNSSTGAIVTTGSLTTGFGSGVAGTEGTLGQGTAPSVVANSIIEYAPASVTGYRVVMPGAAATGLRHWTASGTSVTESVTAVVNADLSGLIGLAHGGLNLDLTATGGTSQVVKQTSLGGALSVARLACADLSDASATCATAGITTIAPLVLESANVVAQRNSTTAQNFNVYNTFTDASNYERAVVGYSGNQLWIGSAKAGSGSARLVIVGSNPAGNPDNDVYVQGNNIHFNCTTTGIECWKIDSNKALVPIADVTYTVGLSTNSPKTVFSRTQFATGAAPGISGCSASIGTGAKNSTGFYTSGTSGSCDVTLTFAETATTGWACTVSNNTTANLARQSAYTTTTAVLSGITVSGDALTYTCRAF